MAVAGTGAAALVLVSFGRRLGQSDFAKPLLLLSLAPLALVALVPGAAPRLSVLLYLLVDLRPWWVTAIVIASLREAGVRFGLHTRSTAAASAILFVMLIDAGFGGWAPNLVFPWTHSELWSAHRGTFVLFGCWVAVCVRGPGGLRRRTFNWPFARGPTAAWAGEPSPWISETDPRLVRPSPAERKYAIATPPRNLSPHHPLRTRKRSPQHHRIDLSVR